ncbi:MAG: hypothetical protein GY757_37765 [bacterium]|nr:hypothetical protein [bacterium]
MANNMIYRKPKRIFEGSGTVNPAKAYYVSLDNVTNTMKQDIKTMVDESRYFSIFAPRQSGKTTYLKRFCDELHKTKTYIVILLNFQKHKNLDGKTFYSRIQKKLYKQLLDRLAVVGCEKLDEIKSFLDKHEITGHISFGDVFEELNEIIEFKKIIVFFDEFDGIPRAELEDFLNTLRDLYLEYKDIEQKALYSVGLVGIRNVAKLVVGGVSPFNIADQVDLPSFSLENVRDLFSQYTKETNQPFSGDAIKIVHEKTAGQPWLVNRLGTILTTDVKHGTTDTIDESDVEKAVQILKTERNVHFDNLYEKAKLYKETFIKTVFKDVKYNPNNEEQTWLEQYGLIRKKDNKAVVANAIYKEIYVELFFNEAIATDEISRQKYILPENRLDMDKIIMDFHHYIARIGVRAFYKKKKPYEVTGQFLLTAWLYQFTRNKQGELRYEVPSGLGRMDIILNFKNRKYIIETKVNHQHSCNRILEEGITQLSEKYLATENSGNGYLVVFDAKTTAGTECKRQKHISNGKEITSFIIGIGQREKEKIKPGAVDDLSIEKKDSGNQVVNQSPVVEIDINVELPAIQENFEELKYLLLAKEPGLENRLKEIGDSWDKIHPGSKKEVFTEPMNKLFRFLKKLGAEESDYWKLISGAEKGVQYAQKLGKGYNSVAQWLALPQIPGTLLK